jgi:hypothetical protein
MLAYDSDEDKTPEGPLGEQMLKVFKALALAELDLTVSPRGEVTAVAFSPDGSRVASTS